MTICKQILLTGYYHATRPVRWSNHWLAVAAQRVPVAVIFFHRVADDRANSWTTSTAMFEQQIGWLQSRFELISLQAAQQRIRSGRNYKPAVSITFDDGYADNLTRAIPMLIERQIPCTYFVTLHNVLTGEPFAHDLVRGDHFAPNSIEQLREMAAAGIEIGCHTCTHADLGAIDDPRLLRHEVVVSGIRLQEALKQRVRYFAFPYGRRENLQRAAFQMAYEAGYEAVCSAYGALNFPGDDAFHIQRVGVDDDLISLKNWLTGDPRKLRIPRYDYGRLEALSLAARNTDESQGLRPAAEESGMTDTFTGTVPISGGEARESGTVPLGR
ncbi:MAG: polysaccharide deacetylase family protein [Planctomycetota bacterium]